jgi:hypothetical protein
MAITASSKLSEVFAIIAQNNKLETQMQSTRLPVGQCYDQTTLFDRIANQPSHISRDIPFFSLYTPHPCFGQYMPHNV